MDARLPIVTEKQVDSCDGIQELLDRIPAHCKCLDAGAYEKLKSRYKKAGITYTIKVGTFEIKS